MRIFLTGRILVKYSPLDHWIIFLTYRKSGNKKFGKMLTYNLNSMFVGNG